MSLIVVETHSEQPLTPEIVSDTDKQVLDCLGTRGATWRYSLLSADRYHMICTFDAPDAEAVRESYRKGGGTFSRIWVGELLQPQNRQPQRDLARLQVIEGTYPPISEASWNEGVSKSARCYSERGIEWIQSYISPDRTRLICEFNAPDAESIREARRKLSIPFDRVWSATLLQPSACPL